MSDKQTISQPGALRFVSAVLALAGVLNVIEGLYALAGDDRFNTNALLFETLTGWGIAYLIIGALQIYAAVAVARRAARGLLMGLGFASLSGIAHFMSIGAYPVWSVTVMILNFAVLFALLTNDDLF